MARRMGAGSASSQSGSALLEALFAVLLFSIGVLALVALQAWAIKNTSDANYRSDASWLANQIIAQMWLDRANVDSYAHHASGSACAFSGAASSLAAVTTWAAQIANRLPGAGGGTTQIQVSTVDGTKQVKVVVCWKAPQDATAHNFAVTARIGG